MQIPIFQINVNAGRREADQDAVQKLADSISKVGLLNPITVDQEYTLIAGLHRLEAAKRLGWPEIECTVKNLDGLLAELAEIDENLIRRKLHYTDEGKQLTRRKEIYEVLHPETQQGRRNGQTSKNETVSFLEAKPFSVDTAEKIGTSRRAVEQKIQVAKNLTPKATKAVKEHDIGFKNALKLSRLPPEQQEDAANQLAAGDIHSVDEYQSVPAEQQNPEQRKTSQPSEPQVSEGCYPTIKASVEDLKNPDKDRRRTPDTFLMTFSFFLQRFCQGIANYSTPEHEAVFPALTREQLGQLRGEVQSVHTALDGLFYKIERMARK